MLADQWDHRSEKEVTSQKRCIGLERLALGRPSKAGQLAAAALEEAYTLEHAKSCPPPLPEEY